MHFGKEEIIISLFSDDIIFCIGNPKESTKNSYNKWIQQSHSIQDESTKLNGISTY